MGLLRRLIAVEAEHSIALDGETQVVTNSAKRRESEGFGCPHCGAPLEPATDRELILGTLSCCGYHLDGETAARLLRGRRLCADS